MPRQRPHSLDVLGWHVLQHRQELPDVVALLVVLLAKPNGAVHAEVLRKESAGREPHLQKVKESHALSGRAALAVLECSHARFLEVSAGKALMHDF